MSGVSVTSPFLSSNITDLGWIFLSPAAYFAIYYFITMPLSTFDDFYVIGFLVCWYASGISYVISVSRIPPQVRRVPGRRTWSRSGPGQAGRREGRGGSAQGTRTR